MMEETNDEQPEMVSHEEAVLAEKEAKQNLTTTPVKSDMPPVLAAPSPLPAFISSSKPTTSSTPASQVPTPPPVSASPVAPSKPAQTQPTAPKAPESPQIPHEGKVKIPEPVASQEPTQATAGSDAGGTSSSLFGWISGNSLVNRVMEKTKSSMESVITTLDPGMKELIYSGGDIDIVVASNKDSKVVPVREAFQKVFGKATVAGKASQASTAAQPVGYTAGLKGAEDRISNLRKGGSIPDDQAIVSVEGFIVEILPDRWFEMSCLLLKDPGCRVEVQTFSQPTPVPAEYIQAAQDKTPSDYPLRWAGLGVTIGEVIESALPHIGHADWQMALSGVSRSQSLRQAAESLAYMYKQKLPTSFVS